MSTTIAKLSAYVKGHKLVTGCIVTGVVALIAIGGVMAWSNETKTTDNATKPAITAAKENDDNDNKKNDEAASAPADKTVVSDESFGDVANDVQQTSNGNQVQLATSNAPASGTITVKPATPVTPPADTTPVNPGQGGGTNPGTGQPDNPSTTPTDPTEPTPSDPTKFDKARISLTFDDGWKSIHDNGLPLLQKHGLVSTQYVNGEPTLKSDPASPFYDYWTGYMDSTDIKDFYTAGHEIAWHTNTHTYDLTTATAEQRAAELAPTTDFLNLLMNVGVQMSDNFAAPFGTQSAESATAAKSAGFNSYRTTYDGYNTKGATDVMNIKVKNVCGVAGLDACNMQATTPEEVASWIAQAKTTNAWLVIVFHEVGNFSTDSTITCDTDPAVVCDPSYAVTPANLDAELALIAAAKANGGVEVQTVQQALNELRPQL